ncbi:MAG: HK97 family phage prohead protease [Sphingomonas sp.]|nr:prohead protease/major capsid protein fusion protein [Sphingomonas sp.]MDX3885993.1 HK97 family phage prohead protease [Sphingomonas sp.]
MKSMLRAPRGYAASVSPMPTILMRSAPGSGDDERRQPQTEGRGVRALSITPGSYNAEARTVEAVLSAGTAVRRHWFTEELEISETAIDLARANAGICPLLDTHNQYELDAVIGRISNVRIEAGQLIGTLHFADNDRGREIEQRVLRGELRAISIGYRVTKWLLVSVDDNDHETWRAVAWELLEASLVPVPADPNAVVRSDIGTEPHGNREEDDDMRRNLPVGAAAAAPALQTAPTPVEAAPAAQRTDPAPPPAVTAPAPALASEPVRAVTVAQIREQCGRTADLGDAFALELIEANERSPLTQADLMERVAERLISARAQPTVNVRVGATLTEDESYRAAIGAAVMLRANPALRLDDADMAAAREFRGMTLMEMARDYLSRTGIRPPSNRLELAGAALGMRYGAMTTSDFAFALSGAVERRIRRAYDEAPQTFAPIVSRGTLPDFKETSIVGLGDAPQLLLVKENAEFTYGALSDTGMSYRLQTYGRIVTITRQAIINDDKNLFGRVPTQFGRRGRELESDLVWGILITSPLMADGLPLFHANHGNLAAAGGAINETTVAAGEQAMLTQRSPDGTLSPVRPAYLIVGPAKKVEAQKFLTAVLAAKTSDVNPFPGTLELIVEPRITGNQWFLAADPEQFDTIEFSHLDGQEGLYIETQAGYEVDGVKTKARLDAGGAPIDHRGFYKNPGN